MPCHPLPQLLHAPVGGIWSLKKTERLPDSTVLRFGFFYGWVMLGVTTITQICTSPGQTYGISAFNRSFREALNLSDTQLTGAYMLGTLLASLPMASVGALFDRYGGRRTLSSIVFVFGLTCLAVSKVAGLVGLFLVFLFLRMCGQGAMELIAANTDAMWFHRKLGTVTGIKTIGSAAAYGTIPVINIWLIGRFGWRTAYTILGISVWIIMATVLLTLFRDRPESVGLLPDGNLSEEDETAAPTEKPKEVNFSVKEAFRTRAYWIMAVGGALWSMIGTGIQFNIQPIFIEHGFTSPNAATWFSVLALSNAIMCLLAGVLADHVRLNLMLLVSFGGLLSAMLLLIRSELLLTGYLTAVFFGVASSFFRAAQATLYVRYYGRKHLGKIRGALTTILVAASAMGPFVMGFLNDRFGGYSVSLWAFIVIVSLVMPLSLLVTPPEYPPHKRNRTY